MNKVGNLNFGQQIVPVKSDKPISPQEKAELVEMKKLLDEKIGKDVVNFKLKDPNNIDIVVNHPNPKIEKEIADKMRELSGSVHPESAPKTATAPSTPKPPAAGKSLDTVA